MVTKVYLIRHGETVGAETKRYKGHIDVPLSENGEREIKKLSDCLHKSTELKAVYASTLSRAKKTAGIIAEPYGLEPVIVEGIKERSFGVWEGMSFDEIKEQYPDAFTAWAANPVKFSPPEGENTLDARDRAMKTFNEIVAKHKGEEIAIVSHGGITRVILCELLGIPLENIFRIEQDFGALNVIELWDYPVVKKINYVV